MQARIAWLSQNFIFHNAFFKKYYINILTRKSIFSKDFKNLSQIKIDYNCIFLYNQKNIFYEKFMFIVFE
jgi:hypothetical protein